MRELLRGPHAALWALLMACSSCPAAQLIVLGVAQDAGLPQAGCLRACCADALSDPTRRIDPSCLAVIDGDRRWLLDATPELGRQLALLDRLAPSPATRTNQNPALAGIFLTHAHIGHYAGLLQLGREVMGAKDVTVYAMPRLSGFLQTHGPWSQLVELDNIQLRPLSPGEAVQLSDRLSITPLLVPHRDEFSETVGFYIDGPRHSALYIPDIDKWERWSRSLADELQRVDRAYVDGTFFDAGELAGRTMAEIPHPLIVETLASVASLSALERAKLHFIHLNHTNPALQSNSSARARIEAAGCRVATTGDRFEL